MYANNSQTCLTKAVQWVFDNVQAKGRLFSRPVLSGNQTRNLGRALLEAGVADMENPLPKKSREQNGPKTAIYLHICNT